MREQDSNIYDEEELNEDFVDALDFLPGQQSLTPIPWTSAEHTAKPKKFQPLQRSQSLHAKGKSQARS